MRLYFKDNLYLCECTYFEKDKPKSCGFRWNNELKVWYSESPASAKLLEQTSGLKFDVEIIDKSSLEKPMSDIKVPSPLNLSYMPFQLAGIEYAYEKENCIIADEMGLGKTIQAIGLINYLDQVEYKRHSAIIVCPNSLKLNWANELKRWITTKRPMFIIGANTFIPSYNRERGDIIIINYDVLRKIYVLLNKWMFDIAIFDEAHYLKNEKAMRTFYSMAIKSDRTILLTGTPIINRPIELYSLLKIIKSPLAYDRNYFIRRYCLSMNGDEKGARNLTELHAKLRDTCMIRRMKRDVLKELPAKIRKIVEIEPQNEKEKEAVKKEMEKYLEVKKYRDEQSLNLHQLKVAEKISEKEYQEKIKEMKEYIVRGIKEIAELRQQTALLKIPYIKEAVEVLVENDEKVIIFAYHHVVIDELADSLSEYNPLIITGETKIQDRNDYVNIFQTDDKHKVIILNIRAGGVGLTLHRSSNVIFVELDWSPANVTQAEDRAHRIGQQDSVNVYHYIMIGSIDQYLAKKIVEKQEIIDKSLNYKVADIDIFDVIQNNENRDLF